MLKRDASVRVRAFLEQQLTEDGYDVLSRFARPVR